ncbi:MAG TPA: serine/threonine-protein kinase, partial [Kofleriaceae bacterium]
MSRALGVLPGASAARRRGCPPLTELREKLEAPGHDPFWTHIRTCARCVQAATTLDPDVMTRSAMTGTRVISVVDPELYGELALWKRGGMYQTWTAVDRRLGRRVVIKGVAPDEPDEARRQLLDACLRREALILARLQHPSIVTLLEAGQWRDGESFYAMELIEGESLREAIRRRHTLVDRLALLPAFAGVVSAIAYSHGRGIIHRDLSPNNIIVGNGMATVIDWTCAKLIRGDSVHDALMDATAHPATGPTLATMGTPGYAPAEQATPTHDSRVDIFTLGATLQFLVTGQRPFAGGSDAEVLDNVATGNRLPIEDCPRELASIIERATELDPAQRYQSADDLTADLERFQSAQLVLAHRYTALQRFVHSRSFKPFLFGFIVAVLGLAGLGGTIRLHQHDRRAEPPAATDARARADAAHQAARRADEA